MAETVDRGNEVILRLGSGITHDQCVEHRVVWISEEDWLDVGIVHTHMLHAVFLFITTRQLVLLDAACHIVVGMGAYHQSVLRFSVHCLRIDIIMFAFILNEPPFILELLEILSSLLIHPRIILRRTYWEINLRLDDMIQTLLIVASLCPRLLRVKHIVGAAFYLFHQLLRRTDSLEWFYNCHKSIFFNFFTFLPSQRLALIFSIISAYSASERYTLPGFIWNVPP